MTSSARATPLHVALLRAVNVAGHGVVTMEALRGVLEDLGFDQVRTLLQSGNVVFGTATKADPRLERQIESGLEKGLGLRASVMVRTAAEWQDVIARNPFPEQARRDPGRLVVMFLKDATTASKVAALQAAITGPEVVRGAGRHLYIVYPDGQGRSKLTGTLIERTVGTPGTARNWNTVLKLGALVAPNSSAD